MATQVFVISILLIVQGSLELLMGGVLLVMSYIIPTFFNEMARQQPMGPGRMPAQVGTFMTIVYLGMGLAGLVAGILHLVAGIRNIRYRGRIFGIVALIAGGLSIATFYCAPTTIGLMIYGLIVYFSADGQRAFELGEKGMSGAEIRELFARGGGRREDYDQPEPDVDRPYG